MSSFFASCWCLPLWFCLRDGDVSNRGEWISALHAALLDGKCICIPKELRETLLCDERDDFSCFDHVGDDPSPPCLVVGVPRRPLYKELGLRLNFLASYKNEATAPMLLLPADHFGFSELSDDFVSNDKSFLATIPDRPTKGSITNWINHVGTRGMLATLGMRHTVGTDPRNLLPPSWKELLEATALPHNENKSDLSVAARARSKHAYRGQDHFFGTVRGPPQQQNIATQQLVVQLLQNAVWINIHTFGGQEGEPILELRVASGYGARWKADWTIDAARPCNVSFRGFLEPQMSDGHERKWRH